MFTTIAYYQAVAPNGSYLSINPVPDPHVSVATPAIRVPEKYPYVIGVAGLANTTANERARLVSPSLRKRNYLYVESIPLALVFGSAPEITRFDQNPIKLEPYEGLEWQMYSVAGAAAAQQGIILLGDGKSAKVDGEIFPMRFAASIALAAGTWVNGAITFEESLTVGMYQIVGMRIRGTNLVAARLVLVGQDNRPGFIAVNANADIDDGLNRRGLLGVWGTFNALTPPTLDALGVTDTAQIGIMDLMKVG